MAVVVGIQFFKGSVKIRMTDHVQRRNIQLLLREQFVFVGSMRRVIGNMQQEITSSPIKSLLLELHLFFASMSTSNNPSINLKKLQAYNKRKFL
ncbi:MAG: hypothetical protein ACLT5W_01415 [Ruminococcus sp.]|jgi:hypothetical protein